jgi:ESS family glutamate:Na+ symporter
LLLGTLLRGCVPVFRKLFLPASVIGGFVGLLIGPIIWQNKGGIPFPKEWLATWSSLPGILIVPVVASTPLGMRFAASKGGGTKATANVLKTFALIYGISVTQVLIGLGVNKIFGYAQPELQLYPTFGYELSQGFSGGHGTAGVIGSYFKGLELPFWELAQGITTTPATFGLVGGMILGIIAINIAARSGQTALLSKPGDIPLDMAKGFQRDPEKQKSLGNETTLNSSIESLTFHLAVILGSCGIAYILLNIVKYYKVPVISQVPIWPYALVVMFGVNFLIQKIGLGTLIDGKTKSRIAGVCSDYAITAAIASMPVHAILQYITPLFTLIVLGLTLTFILVFVLSKRFFTDYRIERAAAIWGTVTGVFLTGLMLLKICDPDYKLPVLNDYSVGFSMTSMIGFIMLPPTVGMMLNYGFVHNVLFQGAIVLAMGIVLFFAVRLDPRKAEQPV